MPMLDRILVQRAEPMATTESGIVVPEDSRTKMMQGIVIAVGPGARSNQSDVHVPPLVKAGDRVLLPEYGGTRIKMEAQTTRYLIAGSFVTLTIKYLIVATERNVACSKNEKNEHLGEKETISFCFPVVFRDKKLN
uniref:10 kDa heat shock protein, mitochondrial n=1 Tax=Glossina austeni TaxID=7395 RepID=A0A1A9VQ84_GLOAU